MPQSNDLVDRAVRFFEFLREFVRQRERMIRTVEEYRSGTPPGQVVWFHDLPRQPEVVAAGLHGADVDGPWLRVDRVRRERPPVPPSSLGPWLENPSPRETDDEPRLLTRGRGDGSPPGPDVQREFTRFSQAWQRWVEEDRRTRPVRELYARLFSAYQVMAGAPEEFDLVFGVGCLTWRSPGGHRIERHVATRSASIQFDELSGRLSISPSDGDPQGRHELDMLEPTQRPSQSHLQNLDDCLGGLDGELIDGETVAELLKRWANVLPEGEYDAGLKPIAGDASPTVAFAPALIMRRRSRAGLLRLLDQIARDIAEKKDVPPGVRFLIDVIDDRGHRQGDGDGAEEYLLPLPANDEQRQIIDRIATRTHVVVQGPPGTGKTHTIANVLAHLLAQGQRVLITAHTDRALREVKLKLPAAIADLCVAAVGQKREDLRELEVAARQLTERSDSFDERRDARDQTAAAAELESLRRQAAELRTRLASIRERETALHDCIGRTGTLAQLIQQQAAEQPAYEWLTNIVVIEPGEESPITTAQLFRVLDLRQASTPDDDIVAEWTLEAASDLPDPPAFANACIAEEKARQACLASERGASHAAFQSLTALPHERQAELLGAVDSLAAEIAALNSRPERWMKDAMRAIAAGRVQEWQSRKQKLTNLIDHAKREMRVLGKARVVVKGGGTSEFEAQAKGLLAHLKAGGGLGWLFLRPAPVRAARALLDAVQVDGQPPSDIGRLERVLAHLHLRKALADASHVLPDGAGRRDGDDGETVLARLTDELQALARALALHEHVNAMNALATSCHIAAPDWLNAAAVGGLREAIVAALARAALVQERRPLDDMQARVRAWTLSAGAPPVASQIAEVADRRDVAGYKAAYEDLQRIIDISRRLDEEAALIALLDGFPGLAAVVERVPPADADWRDRFRSFKEAWTWARREAWLDRQSSDQPDVLARELSTIEVRGQAAQTKRVALLAWSRAVGRLGPAEGQALRAYALAVRQLGRGTGKYAGRKRADVRKALQRCRTAVPAWIMPIYRLAETLDLARDIFDVVIIDEASQAGIDAAFLHYIAPRVIVVGDDLQVSPDGVGLDQAELNTLRDQHLRGIDHAAAYSDPRTSLFDLAKLRYGRPISLREHFRCMPEIIGFSNQVAYVPNGVPLVPLRQYGFDRLEPVVPVHVQNGHEVGTGDSKLNLPEVEAVVARVLACVRDPAYRGKTMGVISLTGGRQAEAIQRQLFDALDPAEISQRDLRCGIAPDFQGSERDIMFLSMVVASNADARAALTMDRYLQRFNVAASRARDQMWLFHSVTLSDVPNTDDMRRRLLEYCLSVRRVGLAGSGPVAGPVPTDQLQPPFESLFEQHVFNEIHGRGYLVHPQHEVHGYRIDLVVVGGNRMLAVECDGDTWHGAAQYARDMGRQRELERCGWTFFRVRASDFYRDRAGSLEPLWIALSRMQIAPGSGDPVDGGEKPSGGPSANGDGGPENPRANVDASADEDAIEADSANGDVDNDSLIDEDDIPNEDEATEATGDQEDGEPEQASMFGTTGVGPTHGGVVLAPWVDVQVGPFARPEVATQAQLIEGLVQIVRAHGPILASHAYSKYVQAAGGQRVGKRILHALNKAAYAAVRKGALLAHRGPGVQGMQGQSLYCPGRPALIVRELGSRDLADVPTEETVALMETLAAQAPGATDEDLFRQVLRTHGLERLTTRVRAYLERCAALMRRPSPGSD